MKEIKKLLNKLRVKYMTIKLDDTILYLDGCIGEMRKLDDTFVEK